MSCRYITWASSRQTQPHYLSRVQREGRQLAIGHGVVSGGDEEHGLMVRDDRRPPMRSLTPLRVECGQLLRVTPIRRHPEQAAALRAHDHLIVSAPTRPEDGIR